MRESLNNLKPYESFDVVGAIRLNTNENPYEIPSQIASKMSEGILSIANNFNRYPQDGHLELKKSLIKHIQNNWNFKIEEDEIICANGSNEIMHEIFNAFGGSDSSALFFTPCYSMYPQYCRDSFTKFISIDRDESNNYQIQVDEALEVIKNEQPDLVVLDNPNNPVGNYVLTNDIIEMIEFAKEYSEHTVFVVDEAYIDFAKYKYDISEDKITELKVGMHEYIHKYKNLIVVRTLSKAFSFAGVRLGYAIGSSKLINLLKIVRLPYNVSSLTQMVAKIAVDNSEGMLQMVPEIAKQKELLFQWLKGLSVLGSNLTVYQSEANFILIKFAEQLEDYHNLPNKLLEHLRDKYNLLIRVVGPSGCFRVTIGTEAELNVFREGFVSFIKEIEGK